MDHLSVEMGSSSPETLILASGSPRRRELLNALGIRFRVVPSGVSEFVQDGESPAEHVSRLALEKALDVAQRFCEHWILGADTVVVIDEKILGKPENTDQAVSMLTSLAGRTHEVYTGYAIVHYQRQEEQRIRCVKSKVQIRSLAPEQIRGYVRTGEPMDKAGAYAIQGVGSAIVEGVEGSYTNVVGLPLCEVARDFQELAIFDFLKIPNES